MTRTRDRALDLLRALAIGRVFLWHATGWPLLTWIGALPVMFFVTGHLFAASVERKGLGATLGDRARRLLLPYWVFGSVMLLVMTMVSHGSWPASVGDLTGWVLPLIDPVGASWQQGWITEPLWYLRTYTWLLVIAAPALWLLRRRAGVLLSMLALSVPATELLFDVRYWALQDALTYGFFFVAGAAVAGERIRLGRGRLALLAGSSTALVLLWLMIETPRGWVVNNSHTLHLLVGCLWLSMALANLTALRTFAEHERIKRLVGAMTERSLSIYLWHAPMLGLGYVILSRVGVISSPLTVSGVVLGTFLGAALTWLVTGLVVPVESFAGRRATSLSSRRLPSRRTVLTGTVTACLLGGTLLLSEPRALELPPTPSKAPDSVDLTEDEALAFLLAPEAQSPDDTLPGAAEHFTSDPLPGTTQPGNGRRGGRQERTPINRSPVTSIPAVPTTPETTIPVAPVTPRRSIPVAGWNELAPEASDVVRDAVIREAGQWVRSMKTDRQITYETGIEIAVLQPGRFRIVTTIDRDGLAAPVGTSIPLASITKSFTAALLLRAVEDGRIDMDAPIGTLAVAPWFTLTRDLTLRDLLAHRSGIATYTSTRTWERDWRLIDGWEPVLKAVEEEGRTFPAGTRVDYSSTNYVVAGLLAAQIYGSPIENLIQEQLLEPLGLLRTRVGGPTPGSPGTGTGNMSGHVTDLARWGVAMWRDKTVLGSVGNNLASYTDPVQLIGYGGFSYCPCRNERGRLVTAGIGANGAEATVRYYAATNTIIAIRIPNGLIAPLEDLITSILTLTR